MCLRLIAGLLILSGASSAPAQPACGGGAADEKIPSPAPEVQGMFPHGGRRGGEVQVRITGKNLKDVTTIRFSRPGARAEVTDRGESEIAARITIEPAAETGRHDFRLISPVGSNIAWFDISDMAETTESEPNDSLAEAQSITLPALLNGVIKKGDYDFFRFNAQAGETITFDLNGTRNGSPLDGVLALYDEVGEQLAYNDDYYIFKDPHITYRFEKAGKFVVRVNGSEEGGSNLSDYRLTIGATPYVSYAMPAGAQRGQTATVLLHGVNLAGVKRVTLGASLVRGEVVKTTEDQAEVRLPVPSDLPPGKYNLYAEGSIRPVPFVIGDLPEIAAASSNVHEPYPVRLPVVANGVLARKGEAHYFRFHVDDAAKYVLSADSMELGFPLDPLVSLHDIQGRRIAYQDEPNTNNGLQPSNLDPHLVVDIPTAGDYIARIRDFAYRGAPDFVYRLTIKRAEPSFEVRVHVPDETLFRGRENRIKVRVRRLEGWDGPVEIRAENLPPGVTAKPVVADSKNSTYLGGCAEVHTINGTDVELPIRVASDAPAAQLELRFVASGAQNGKTVEETGWTRYRWRSHAWQDAESGQLLATIADAPLLILESPGMVKLTGGKEGTFELLVKRFDGGSEPLILTAGKGADNLELTADPVQSADAKVKVKLRLRDGALPASFVITGTSGARLLGQSPEIRLQREEPSVK